MKNIAIALAAAIAAITLLPAPAAAHGKIDCRAGPRNTWQPIDHLRQKLIGEGWTIKKAHPERDCYEVYGKTPEGDNVESFFHPVTLQKILVLKRGRELFRASGY